MLQTGISKVVSPAQPYISISRSSVVMLLLDLVWAALATLLILSFVKRLVGRPDKHLPPGPKGFPLIGNLLDVPPSSQWRTFAEWKERWGE